MQHRHRTFLTVCLVLLVLLGMVYLSANQGDYEKRTLNTIDYPEMTTRAMFFEKGAYRFSFHYTYAPDTEVQIVRTMTADETNALPSVLASAPLNEGGYTEITLTLPEAAHDLQLRYTKPVELGFTNIESIGRVWHDTAALMLLIAIVAAVFLWLGRKPSALNDTGFSEQTVRLVLLAASVIATLPIMRGYFVNGHDLAYHLMRIENIKDGLLTGQLPVRVGPAFWNGLGYNSSLLYPELFLYLPAVMRLCGVSLMVSYQIFVFLINLAAFFTAYYAIRRLTGKASVGLIASLVYGLSVVRIVTLYLRGATGEVLALIFFPCVMLGMAEALQQGKISKWLIAGMTGLIQSHVISVEIGAIACGAYTVIAIVLGKTSFKNLLRLAAAAGITLLINFWFLLPFLLYSREPLRMLVFETRTMLHAVYPAQLFSSFAIPFGESRYLGTTAEMALSVGLLPLIGVFFYILSVRHTEAPLRGAAHISLVFGAAALIISSTLFPWTYVMKIPVVGNLLNAIQFPWRYLGAAGFFLSVVFAVGAYGVGREHLKAAVVVCLLLAVLNVAPTLDQFFQYEKQTVLMAGKTDMAKVEDYDIGDYAYADTDFEAAAAHPFVIGAPGGAEIAAFAKHGAGLDFRYTAEAEQTVTLPLYLFHGYTAMLDGAQELEIIDGDNHLIALSLPAGEHAVSVRYTGLPVYNAANWVSLVTLLSLIAWALARKYRRRGNAPAEGGPG